MAGIIGDLVLGAAFLGISILYWGFIIALFSAIACGLGSVMPI